AATFHGPKTRRPWKEPFLPGPQDAARPYSVLQTLCARLAPACTDNCRFLGGATQRPIEKSFRRLTANNPARRSAVRGTHGHPRRAAPASPPCRRQRPAGRTGAALTATSCARGETCRFPRRRARLPAVRD